GAVISQNSWGYTAPDVFEQVVLDAIDYFIAEAGKNVTGQQTGPMNGGLAIFSAGNFNSDENYYPAYYEPVLAVASTTHKDIKAQYSNYGSWVDITAPGGETFEKEEEGVLSTLPGNQYGSFMGTSMACPHVSGVAGLILSKFGKPGLRPEVVRERLRQSVDDIDAANNGYVGLLGTGRLNAALALAEDDNIPPAAVNDLRVTDNEIGKITLSWTSPKDRNGVVAEYDLRYATSPITDTTFADATSAGTLPVPGPPGTTDTFTVSGLPGGVLFYFVIRSKDFEGNTSALSNIVSKTSALAPVLTVSPESLTENLKTAERSSRILTIKNEGAGPLEFKIRESPEAFATATPTEGTVPPGNSRKITVDFDASGLFTGTYKQDLVLQTNDPAKEEVAIPLTLQVTNNGSPIASIKEDTLDFKSVQAGRSRVRMVTVSNAGSEPLVINEVTCDVPAFVPDGLSTRSIDPFESADVRITFSPASAGLFSGTVFIRTNDPQRAALSVSVRGEGLEEAPILASPDSFNESLERGTKTTRTLVLHNNGSQDRSFRIDVLYNGVATTKGSKNTRLIAEQNKPDSDSTRARQRKILQQHQSRLAARPPDEIAALKTFGATARPKTQNSQTRKTQSDEAGIRQYMTGFEEFNEGPVGHQEDWFTTWGWTIETENPAKGIKHLRGKTERSGTGEEYAVSPYLFEAEEYYYPQYTSSSMRINADKAKGTTWEIVPQDPWSYIATRIRINADGSIEAMVVDNDYMTHFKKVPVTLPSGYFDLAIEYNNWGSDTSGFPTYLLFINNQHVFSGTGLASGIGQVAFVSSMQAAGSIFDIDEFKLAGDEYLPLFIRSKPEKGVIPAGQAADVSLEFDASVMKFGTYRSDLIVRLDDDTDSLVIPTQLHVTGEASMTRDVYAIYGEMNKGEEGIHYITLTNTGGQPIAFKFQTDLEGLNVNPASGTLEIRQNKTIAVSFKSPPGIYNDEIVLTTNTGIDPEQIPVSMTVFDSGSMFYSPPHVQFDINAGEITTKSIQLRNDGVNTVSFMTDLSPFAQPFLQAEPASATITDDPLDFAMTFDARNLDTGKHEWWIRFLTNDAERRTIDMPLIVNVLPNTRGAGKIGYEIWTGLPGRECAVIPVATPPSSTSLVSSLQTPSNIGDNYGSRVRGYVRAPQTGYYTFWIASNDNSELWLSEDESELNKQEIASVNGYTNPAQWNKYPTQMSSGIFLEANKRYYIEALHKEGVGTDHLAVGWQLPDEAMERPIPDIRLLPYKASGNEYPLVNITQPAQDSTFISPATVEISADASDPDGNIVK
ncbi:MAG TPA: S8 family serine peptidase, partial [Chryseosolibacter sp.]